MAWLLFVRQVRTTLWLPWDLSTFAFVGPSSIKKYWKLHFIYFNYILWLYWHIFILYVKTFFWPKTALFCSDLKRNNIFMGPWKQHGSQALVPIVPMKRSAIDQMSGIVWNGKCWKRGKGSPRKPPGNTLNPKLPQRISTALGLRSKMAFLRAQILQSR